MRIKVPLPSYDSNKESYEPAARMTARRGIRRIGHRLGWTRIVALSLCPKQHSSPPHWLYLGAVALHPTAKQQCICNSRGRRATTLCSVITRDGSPALTHGLRHVKSALRRMEDEAAHVSVYLKSRPELLTWYISV